MIKKIKNSIEKFDLNLKNKVVLTEAASGNFVITPILAAISGAKVIAITQDSKYASIKDVKRQTFDLAKKFDVENSISIVTSKNDIIYSKLDILTNTGFVRPINKEIIDKLSPKCVIPLMWEPWEFRSNELDLDYCVQKNIKVYGTNESDYRLQTMKYIGYTVLFFLLENKMTPFSTKVLVLGNEHFTSNINNILHLNKYNFTYIHDYSKNINIHDYQAIVIAEHEDDTLIIGDNGSFINKDSLATEQFVIHICGNVETTGLKCKINTKIPADFGYMSFTTDFIDSQAVIDLHCAGLKVAEGMIKANQKELVKDEYKQFMEIKYPALAFENRKYW